METGLLMVIGSLLLVIMALVLVGLILLGIFDNRQVAEAPPLDSKISLEEVAARRAKEEARLNSYSWLDKEAGVVRIPISQAMILIAESGLPVGTPTPTATPMPTATSAPSVDTPVPAETVPTATPAPTVDLANVSFQTHVLPIFEQHCTECHGGEEPEEGLRLTSHAEVIAGSFNGSVIEPGDVENSYLIEQIVTGKMPKKGPKLTPTEIEIITAWVEAGAPDN
jgi:hypothetical protein